jgi:glycosyltransferase involved in cell wall biosynthesis
MKRELGSPCVTIVIVLRERFSYTRESLASIFEHTCNVPYELVYVDGGSPSHVRRFLIDAAEQHDFTLVRTPHYLPPNRARNLGLQYVRTKYVVFYDNDVIVSTGWLSALVKCAEGTAAASSRL